MEIEKIELINFGVCTPQQSVKTENNKSPVGYFIHSESIEFASSEDRIVLKKGLSFGISYKITPKTGEPDLVWYESKIIHPEMIHPETKQSFSETYESKNGWADEIGFDFMTFEFDWELKEGIWVFQILQNKNVFLEKAFTIVRK